MSVAALIPVSFLALCVLAYLPMKFISIRTIRLAVLLVPFLVYLTWIRAVLTPYTRDAVVATTVVCVYECFVLSKAYFFDFSPVNFQDYLSQMVTLIFPVIPASDSRKQPDLPLPLLNLKTSTSLVQRVLLTIFWGVINLYASKHLFTYLQACLPPGSSAYQDASYISKSLYCAIFFAAFTSIMVHDDVMDAIIVLLSKGKYGFLKFTYRPFISTSIREFWSVRYNPRVKGMFHEHIFLPATKHSKMSAEQSAGLVFVVSGALHWFTSYGMFQTGEWISLVYFSLHGVACILEKRLYKQTRIPVAIRALISLLFILGTSPLFLGLFIEKGMIVARERNDSVPLWMTDYCLQ
jgi:hypothetical protein